MSTHASTKIDQKEYLKKYLSGDKVKKKKKDKKHKSKNNAAVKVKIIDDDVSAADIGHQIDEELLLTGDDAPQIVGEYIEETSSKTADTKWRSITIKDESPDNDYENVHVKQEEDLWGRKASDIKIKDEFASTSKQQKRSENRKSTPDISAPRRRYDDDDNSPPRRTHQKSRTQRNSQSSMRISSPRSNKRSYHSPPRRRGKDQSPPRRRRKDSSDQSPPRFRGKDQSPPRRDRKESSDQSPPRRRRKNSSDQSLTRRRSKDQSPPRRRRKNSSDLSSSRPRDKDQSPPRRRGKYSSDQSPPRRRLCSKSPTRIKIEKRSPDNSPPRKTKMKRESPPRSSRWEKRSPSSSPPPTHKSKATKTLDGKTAGLQDAQSLKVETEERRRKEERMYAKMSSDISGRDAEVQVRNTGRRGRRARDAQEEDPEVQRRKEEREQKKKELYDRWGKGLKQIEDHRARLAEQEYEGSKPLARYSNDEDLDRHLREKERADDPMLEYMRQKRKERDIQANVPTKPVYEGTFPENRFGIRPGYRWDGVDRSNGFEKKWFDVQNEKRARQDEAYKYSVEDM